MAFVILETSPLDAGGVGCGNGEESGCGTTKGSLMSSVEREAALGIR